MDYEKLKIKSYRCWDVYLHANQCYLGRVFILLREDGIEDFLAIEGEVRDELFSIGRELKAALHTLFQPDKMNYAALSNKAPKVHLHVIPRYKDSRAFAGIEFSDTRWGENYAPYDRSFALEEPLLFKIRDAIREGLLTIERAKNPEFRFHFQPVDKAHRPLVHAWLKQPHVAKWFYGQGLQNTLNHLDDFLNGSSSGQYWLGLDQKRPFALLITSSVEKPHDELTKWCTKDGEAMTLDLLIGETDYLNKGYSSLLIQDFLLSQFPNVTEILIDPETTNSHAIHIYKKVGFTILGEFIPSYSPHPHYMMRLDMQTLKNHFSGA